MSDPTNGSNDTVENGEEIELIFEEDEEGSEASETSQGEEAADSDSEQLRAELDRLRELYLRKLAEFDNFRKRTDRERVELHRTAGETVVRDLLPVIDNFERAISHTDDTDSASYVLGVEMIAKQLMDVLQKQGLAPVDPVGEEFRPEYHEAVQRVEDSDLPAGSVVSVLAKGYFFGGKLIRPAMVSVAVDPQPPDETPSPAESESAEEHVEEDARVESEESSED